MSGVVSRYGHCERFATGSAVESRLSLTRAIGDAECRRLVVRRTADLRSAVMSLLSRGAEAQKEFEPLVHAGELARRHLSEDAADSAFVDRSKVVNEGVRRLRQAARARR